MRKLKTEAGFAVFVSDQPQCLINSFLENG